jgi:GrpB-like predicted nucleotidyltransferase (UPF0157 family)
MRSVPADRLGSRQARPLAFRAWFSDNAPMARKFSIAAYDPAWEDEGLAWAQRVRDALNGLVLDIDHVGSTAVPGLDAKNVIDIQALVFDLDEVDAIIAPMTAAGFRLRADVRTDIIRPGYPDHHDQWEKLEFRGPKDQRDVRVHVREFGSAAARVGLLLRDFLRADPIARAEYAALKQGLAAHVKDQDAYATLKRPWVAITLRLAEAWAERVRWRPGAGDA